MKLNIGDYEEITLVMDDEEFTLKKDNIGFIIKSNDDVSLKVEEKSYNELKVLFST